MLLETLKQQTRQQHSALEEINALPQSLPEYVALLEAFFGFVEPWERKLAERLPATDPVRHGREKTAWLRADLMHFGYSAAAIAALPRCEDLPTTESRAEIPPVTIPMITPSVMDLSPFRPWILRCKA